MSRRRKIGILATAAAFLLGVAGQSHAKSVFQEDFRGSVSGLKGKGEIVKKGDGFAYQGPGGEDEQAKGSWLEYDLKGLGLNPQEGTIELDLTRSEKDSFEALGGFLDANGEPTVLLTVYWRGLNTDEPDLAAFALESATSASWHTLTPGFDANGVPVFWPGLYPKRTIPRGRTVHVAWTWGSHGVNIYLDGVRLPGVTGGLPVLQSQLAKSRKLVVGGMTSYVQMPGGAWGMAASTIANVQIDDKELPPAQFAKPIVPDVPAISSVSQDVFKASGFSGKLVAGNNLQVSLAGTPGAKASFDLVHSTDINGRIDLSWKGYGVYLEEKVFYDAGEINLRDVKGYRVYASVTPINLAAPAMEPVALLKVQEQSYSLEGLEMEKPYYVAVLAEMQDGTLRTVMSNPSVPMTETSPGVYAGSYTVGSQDRYPNAVVVGRLTNGSASSSLVDAKRFTVDATLTIEVVASPQELRADEKSTANVAVTVTDANGKPVIGHKIKFLLATTSQYTGVVGGGAFAEQVGGTITETAWGQTDLFGKVTATYVAGFAAKTAIIVARDMTSNDTGAGWVKTYIQASAGLELEPVKSALADEGYAIAVTSSDSWLTADGKSQARITARVTLGGQPVEGHKVGFAVAGAGSIRVVKDTTDSNGEARAVYTAGKKIGIALITATDTTVGISGSVAIELRSDAPAKINIKIDPEKLPADGFSTAKVAVTVTDINDNPNENTEVEYSLTGGSGRLRDAKGLTDRNGESDTEYVAGRTPGKVTFMITVRSTVPTEEEFVKARDLALAVPDYAFF